ncbi:MAG: 3-oxo-tetronate kinase, partial [Pseudomonadota bacterium]
DSTPDGNIGPVADALAEALEADPVIFCPAFPGTGRSVYQGHLFVGDRLLSESGMETHPLTPMTDPDLRRWLAQQSRHPVGHVPAQTVFAGPDAIAQALREEQTAGRRHVVVDATRDADLVDIGRAAAAMPLVTGGSGVALGLPDNFGCKPGAPPWAAQTGPAIILSGSCSTATRGQVAHHQALYPTRKLSADDIIERRVTAGTALAWAQDAGELPLIATSADPGALAAVQTRYGRDRAAAAVERFFAALARGAQGAGFTRIITAGGETSGAVVEGLSLGALTIGPEIDPGVPALRAHGDLVLALKSGNFGAPDFFEKAARVLGS